MNMMNKIHNFNPIDRLLYFIEEVVLKAVHLIKQEKAPDPEMMIMAATQHLQNENEQLKEYRIPEKLIFDHTNRTYLCPKCKKELNQELIEKYRIKCCAECGKRLLRVNNPAY